jgi:cytidylate kinase
MTPHSIEILIDRQMRRWDLQQVSEGPRVRPPCVALSRLPHSGATEIGRRLAERLDYGFFGREIVDQIASERGIQRQLVAGLDEKIHGTIDRYVADSFRVHAFTESDYLRHVVRVIATIGNRGMAVILGRGAVFILSPARALRVFVVAATPARIDRLAESRGLSQEQAAEVIGEEDARRREFFRHQFGVAPDDPLHYDIVLNTGTLSIDAAVDVIIDALRCRFPGATSPAAAR